MRLSKPRTNQEVYAVWEHRWQGNDACRLTLVGKAITRAKQRGLREIVRRLDCPKIIDVGCGMGFTFRTLSQMNSEAVGIDVSKAAIAICQSKGFNVSLQRLEDVSQSYDLVFSDGLLEHFPDFQPYTSHLMRISNKYVLIAQTDHDSPVSRLLLFLEAIFRRGKNVPEFSYRIKEFVTAFERGGFELVLTKSVFLGGFKLLLFRI